MNDLARILLQEVGPTGIWANAAVLTFLRVGAAMALLPAIGEHSIPARFRLVIGLVLTLAVLPATMPSLQDVDLAKAFLPEVLIGLFTGLSLRFFVFALSIAGSIIANASSLSQLFSPGAEPQPAVSNLLVLAGLTLALQADLLPRMLAFLLLSYSALPAGQWPEAALLADWVLRQGDMAFGLAFQLAMPFVIASLLYNLALGVINRAMPQLMVTFIGAPALSLGGLALLAVASPLILSVWLQALNAFVGASVAVR